MLTAVLVFFLNMWSTRQTIVRAKQGKLDMVRDHLAAVSLELDQRASASPAPQESIAKGQSEDVEALLDTVAAWVTYEERIEKVSEWPYTADIRRNLVLSTLLPLVVWLIREVVLDFIKQMVISP
jgi:hypothetical protein